MTLTSSQTRVIARAPFVTVAFALLLTGGCASSSSSSPGGSTARAGSDVITREELAEFPELSAWDVIRRLHNTWLRSRAQNTSFLFDTGTDMSIAVYLNGQRDPGGIEVLKSLRVNEIDRIERLDGNRATARFGPDNGGGAILITFR